MPKKRVAILSFLFLLFILFIFVSSDWRIMSRYHRYVYDLKHPQTTVTTKSEIDEIFNGLVAVEFDELDLNYKKDTHSDRPPFNSFLKSKQFYLLDRDDFYKKLVGNYRVEDFVARDTYYRKAVCRKSNSYYWLIDKRLVYKTLELQNELENAGYRRNGFSITNGHRHPKYNKKVGGASKSCHIKGEAVDIHIKDVDGNGRYESKDKEIILKILNEKVIRGNGGIGRYPDTRAVHFDVRGYKARWDSY